MSGQYPDSGISGAVICGTGWQPTFAMPAMIKLLNTVCKKNGEKKPKMWRKPERKFLNFSWHEFC